MNVNLLRYFEKLGFTKSINVSHRFKLKQLKGSGATFWLNSNLNPHKLRGLPARRYTKSGELCGSNDTDSYTFVRFNLRYEIVN